LIARLGFFWAMAASSNDLVSLWTIRTARVNIDVDKDLLARSGDLVSCKFCGNAGSPSGMLTCTREPVGWTELLWLTATAT